MAHHVQLQHLYSHDRTCTHSGFRRRHPILVAFHICYLLGRAIIHEMPSFMSRFRYIIRCLHPLWRSCPLYIVRGDDHIWHLYIMPIHGHCTLMYPGLLYVYLQSYADIYHCILLMSGWFFHLGIDYSTSRMDIMYFGHHVTTLGRSHLYGLPCPSIDSLDPPCSSYTLMNQESP